MLRVAGLPLLAWFVADAVAKRARWDAQAYAALGWALACALSTASSIAPRLSLLGEPSQREGLLTAIALVGLHLGARRAHRDERDVRTTLTVLLFAGLAAAAYAQLQVAGLDPIPWQGVHTYATPGGVALRPSGPLGNPILLGVVLAAILPIALVRLASAQGDAARLVPAAALLAASLVPTLSRGAWLAAAVGFFASAGIALAAGARSRRIAWTAALSALPALVFALTRASGSIAERFAEGAGGRSLASRELMARAALELWRERPLLGQGPDAFGLAFPRVQAPEFWRAEWIGVPLHAHSAPLQLVATLGLAGAVAGLAWVATAAAAWVRAWRRTPSARFTLATIAGSLAALGIAALTNVVGLAGAALFAVLTALIPAVEEKEELAEPREARGRNAIPVATAAVVLVLTLAHGARELEALSLARTARDGPARERLAPEQWRELTAVRVRNAWAAARLGAGEDWLWRAACDASLDEADALGAGAADASIAAAEEAARRALALVPVRAVCHERLAQALAVRALRTGAASTADSADASYERATRLAPADGWLLVSWIRFQLARRDGARAHTLASRLVALYPEAAVGHTLSGASLLLLDRRSDALAELRRAQAARWEEDAGAQRAEVDRLVAELEQAGAGRFEGR